MAKINANKFIGVLLTKYNAKEIDRKKFALLLTGQESDFNLSNSKLMGNCIDDEIKNIFANFIIILFWYIITSIQHMTS